MAPGIAAALVSFCFLIGVAFFVQRYIALRRERKRGFYPSTAAMGTALQELQKLTRPNIQYVLQEKRKEDKQDDEEGGPDDPDIHAAHRHCSLHRTEIENSSTCGCFYCMSIFRPDEIAEWVDDGQTAICPKCPVDSVIGSASGFQITHEFLQRMHDHWF